MICTQLWLPTRSVHSIGSLHDLCTTWAAYMICTQLCQHTWSVHYRGNLHDLYTTLAAYMICAQHLMHIHDLYVWYYQYYVWVGHAGTGRRVLPIRQ